MKTLAQMPFKISPSLMACKDWVEFKSILQKLEHLSCDSLHIDVMDGHYVPNLAFGPYLVDSIKRHTSHFLDIHLMINCLDTLLEKYIEIKPRIIYFHPEVVTSQVEDIINKITSSGIQAGIAIHPDIKVNHIRHIMQKVNHVLIMTVYPGFSGQKMIIEHLNKCLELKNLGFLGQCWVDGGVTKDNFDLIKKYKVDGVVMGSDFFKTLFK